MYAMDIENDTSKGAQILSEILDKIYGLTFGNEMEIEIFDEGKIN